MQLLNLWTDAFAFDVADSVLREYLGYNLCAKISASLIYP